MSTLTAELAATVRAYDTYAPYYERIHSVFTPTQTIISLMKLLRGLQVLDVGCGVGRTVPFFNLCGVSDYTGIDASAGMIRSARRLYPRNHFEMMRMEECASRFKPLSFDFIFCYTCFYFLPPHLMEQALRNFASLIEKGKMVYLQLFFGKGSVTDEVADDGVLRRGMSLGKATAYLVPVMEWNRMLKAAGFEMIHHMQDQKRLSECVLKRT